MLGQETRFAHVGNHAAVVLALHADSSLHRLKRNRIARSIASLEREAPDAACAVAALLDLISVAVEDAVAKRITFFFRRIKEQKLVRSNAETPVGETAHKFGGHADGLRNAVENNEVIPGALHFGEV